MSQNDINAHYKTPIYYSASYIDKPKFCNHPNIVKTNFMTSLLVKTNFMTSLLVEKMTFLICCKTKAGELR